MVDETKAKRRRGRKGKGESLSSSSSFKKNSSNNNNKNSEGSKKLIQLDGVKWFDYGKRDFADRNQVMETAQSNDVVVKYRTLADSYMRGQQQSNGNNDDDKYLEGTIRQGTLKDKIAALAVVLSNDSLSKWYYIDTLLEYLETPNSRVSQMAAEALEDLFLHSLLPPRKLVSLSHRNLSRYDQKQVNVSPKLLLIWRLEELVAEKYQRFLSIIYTQLNSNLVVQKVANLRLLSNLIRTLPEQEGPILKQIINKLGDPTKKVASAASHQLGRLLQLHPAMTTIVAREVQQFIFRHNNSKRAVYNGMIFLNQLQLSRNDGKLPGELLQTYFKVFDLVVLQTTTKPASNNNNENHSTDDDPIKSRLLSAILSGVNRAHPYLVDDTTMQEHIDALFRISHVSPPNARTQSLLLLFQLTDTGTRQRFYRALYATITAEMFQSGKHLTMYFNLLYKALKHETDVSRLMSFCKRLFCMVVHAHSPVVASVIFLLNEITKEHPVLLKTYTELLSGRDALRTLDLSKREPQFALCNNHGESAPTVAGDETLAPGWEISLLRHHFHPSVSKFAQEMGSIEYSGDPLKDFGLTPFLDKFAYRNPKKQTADRKKKPKTSVAERRFDKQTSSSLPLNDPKFLKQETVAVEDEFFRQFFVERSKRDEQKGTVRHERDETELDALDKEEDRLDHQRFEDYEAQWESDEEEEAFVDSLMEKIMDDHAVGMDVDELDDEDPDMDDWDDLKQNDEQPDNSANEDASSDEDHNASSDDSNDDDDSEQDDESSADSNPGPPTALKDADDFMDNGNSSCSSSDSDDAQDEDDLALIGEEDDDDTSSDGHSENEEAQLASIQHNGGTFANAEDFEEMIARSWAGLKRPNDSTTATAEKSKRRRR